MDKQTLIIALHLLGKKGIDALRDPDTLGLPLPELEDKGLKVLPMWEKAEDLCKQLSEKQVRVLHCWDEQYPPGLKKIQQFPPVIYCLGNIDLLKTKGIGICGSRNASSLGLTYARFFGKGAYQFGLTAISGYAKGVDAEAYNGSVELGGSTIAVLAEGILRFRPKKELLPSKPQQVLIVSQFPPKQTWNVGAAMERNRIIIGLSEGLFVIEASETGGTITAGRQALSMGKPLFAIAYKEAPDNSKGNQILISEGASPLTGTTDLKNSFLLLKDGRVSSQSPSPTQRNLFND